MDPLKPQVTGSPIFLISLIILALLSLSCSKRHDFAYELEEIDALKQATGLRIAILPFQDAREFRDEGSKNYAYIPLVPTSAQVEDAPQNPADRTKGVYFFPDLVAYGLALDFYTNQQGSVAHFAPEVLEDYDIIVDGMIHSMAHTDRKLTYGLSAAAFTLYMFGAPQGAKSIDFVATYRVRTPNGKTIYQKKHEADWTSVQIDMPFMEGVNSSIREANTAFLKDFAPQLTSLRDGSFTPREYFYHALDPELRKLHARKLALIQSSQTRSVQFNNIVSEISRREGWLEKYRATERKIVNAQQQYFFEKQHIRLQKIAEVRSQQRAIEQQQEAMEDARNRQALQNISGALVAGVMPAMQSASAVGSWGSAQTQLAAQDLGAAFAGLPPNPSAPPPDLSRYLQELDVSFEGLESGGTYNNRQGSSSLKTTRKKFLTWYRKRITPLAYLLR